MADELFFYLAFGGATLILVWGGFRIMRRWPRLQSGQRLSLSEWRAIRDGLVDVEAGRTKPLEQIREELRWKEAERERIRKQEVCSDKSHWHSETDRHA